jgi:hypothetical protein
VVERSAGPLSSIRTSNWLTTPMNLRDYPASNRETAESEFEKNYILEGPGSEPSAHVTVYSRSTLRSGLFVGELSLQSLCV